MRAVRRAHALGLDILAICLNDPFHESAAAFDWLSTGPSRAEYLEYMDGIQDEACDAGLNILKRAASGLGVCASFAKITLGSASEISSLPANPAVIIVQKGTSRTLRKASVKESAVEEL